MTSGSTLTCHIEGGIEIAGDCQIEFKFDNRTNVVFKPFESNFATLLVRPRKSHPHPNVGHLIVKKAFGHLQENQFESLTTIDLDLRDPMELSSLPDLKNVAIGSVNDDDDDDVVVDKDYEDVEVPNNKDKSKNVINVKEYSPRQDEDDLVFIQVNGNHARTN